MYKTTYHRDGTVTMWDVYSQSWLRRIEPGQIAAEVLASLMPEERARVMRHGAA